MTSVPSGSQAAQDPLGSYRRALAAVTLTPAGDGSGEAATPDAGPVVAPPPLPPPPAADELLAPDGAARCGSRPLADGIARLGSAGLLTRRDLVRDLLDDDGVTYGSRPCRWEVDPLPVVLPADEWQALADGIAQRAELLDLLLADLYGPRTVLSNGLLPPAVVFGHEGFLREADQVRLPGPRQLLLAGADLGRGADGRWRVFGHRTQAPSGAGYAMADRRVVSRVLPGLHRDLRPARLRTFFHALRAALEEAAPAAEQAPRVVLLTPGPTAETAFDQAFLATLFGYPLVEGRDLSVRDGRVWLRSPGRPEPVDVVLRLVDPGLADPLDLRQDSRLGVAGLLEAARQGTVSVVNPFGAAVLENPGLVPYLPDLCRALLGTDPLLEDAATYWCGEDLSRRHVLARLGELVIRPIARGEGTGRRFGWELSDAERDRLRRRIEAEPWRWCGQEPLPLGTAPVVTSAGLQPRRMVLRTFAVAAGDGYQVMSGGLARVAAGDGLLACGPAGAVAKDVWVQAGEPSADTPARARPVTGAAAAGGAPATGGPLPSPTPRAAEDLFWLGRYAERAEDTVRLLRVVAELAEDHALRPGTPGAAALRVLLD
ncbi:MAG TPA: circularly permuted type 2 ATP-grasp protein, partial [Kineosporiaceae bacterium]|nr:circularly permuted type 2 ATP-grasp protein [Kineosporiaceae bacterium]